MSILQAIFLRYRGEGHVRFDIPAALCQAATAQRLVTELWRIEGVYRVDISARHRKLSIRYMPMVVDFDSLIKSMAAVIRAQEAATPAAVARVRPFAWRSGQWLARFKNSRPVRWIKEKTVEAKETATALKIVARRGLQKSETRLESGELLITFLNDVLVFYLIKVHWNLITRYWLRRPWEFRYQWLATLYLLFLLLRSRQQKLR